ncbi:Tfp pilus assembly protein FimT [Allocatelliglobosispora scoriae]|uniref:Tfp pilus assembly protein FimT n=1 Tax=Allocatelliglobosispora scoriae TaxID=643052 RepID=A0A841C260_9ACTN|nr:hypothetical protein [Allocatelliglobosispora scoriae]MBB5873976.1 Tfp pilus assembly protein FimT [Allocatelliglobosispora scoriae]
MSSTFSDPRKQRMVAYVLLGAVTLIAIVSGLVIFNGAKATKQANTKASELATELTAAGLPAPDQQQIARALGSDGGAACSDPSNSLKRAMLYAGITNGAAGPGQRPVIGDSKIVQGQRLIIKVYCPDQLADFDKLVADLDFDDVIND